MIGMFVDDIDLGRYSRHAMYNAWRAVSPPPQDIPLAVCDARTVQPEDEVTIRAVSLERSGEITHDTTGYRHSASHRWHYYPDMTRDEVLVFKAHDTDPAPVETSSPHRFRRPVVPGRGADPSQRGSPRASPVPIGLERGPADAWSGSSSTPRPTRRRSTRSRTISGTTSRRSSNA